MPNHQTIKLRLDPNAPRLLSAALMLFATRGFVTPVVGETNSVELDGVITYAVIRDGKTEFRTKRSFSIQTGSQGWKIQLVWEPWTDWSLPGAVPESPVAPGSEYQGVITNEATSDGTNLYLNTIYDAKAMGGRATRKVREYVDIFDVNGEPVPQFHGDCIFPVWLAYASPDYLQRHAAQLIPPIVEMGHTHPEQPMLNYRYEFDINREGLFPFPRRIDFFRCKTNGTSYLKAAHIVEAWKTANGVAYPSSARFQVYASGTPSGSNGVRVQFSLVCDSAKAVPSDFRRSPEAKPGTCVKITDHRENVQGEPVAYLSTNGISIPEGRSPLRFLKK